MRAFCIGRNFMNHVLELNNPVPSEPVVFIKSGNIPQGSLLSWSAPTFGNNFHYETELVLRFADPEQYSPHELSSYFDAYSLGLDITERTLQKQLKEKGLPWERAKSFDTSGLIGDWKSGFPALPVKFSLVKGENILQCGNTANWCFSLQEIVAYLLRFFAPKKGDVLFTGTPEGVGQLVSGKYSLRLDERELLAVVVD